jgi:LacI family transcriptional regulator
MASATPRPVTLRQVAQHAGVHVSTVSRALDPERRHLIGEAVLARVEASARELGFRPNYAAASLRRGRSMSIGVLVPNMTNPVMGQIMQGAETALVKLGYFPLMVSMRSGASTQLVAERLLSQRIDGVIVATAPQEDVILRTLLEAGIHAVLVNRPDKLGRLSAVIGDAEHAMALSIDHLHALGHRRIALLAGPQSILSGTQRLNAALKALQAHKLKPAAVGLCDEYSRDAGRRACLQLLASRKSRTGAGARFTAICAANDILALGAYDAMHEACLAIPRDMSIVGQNDIPLVDLVSPPLTTVRVQHHEMGMQAARILIEEIEARAANGAAGQASKVVLFRHEMVVRGSTAAPRS